MADINVVNSQGTIIYVVDMPADLTTWEDCSVAIPLIKAGKQVLCPQSLGNLEQTRSVTEYKCLSSNDSTKVTGSISRGTLDIGMLFDPTDIAGQEAVIGYFDLNTPFIVGIEYPDIDTTLGTTDASGTIRWFPAAVSREAEIVEMDAAILYEITAEVAGAIRKCDAVPGSA